MEAVITRLFRHLNRQKIELEVEEELRFHIELLTCVHIQQGLPPAEAKAAATKRFGDIEQIKNQCMKISRRNHPLMRALKSFLVLVFLTGFSVRGLSADVHFMQVGTLLMAVSVLSHLLLYARSFSPSDFLSKPKHRYR